jgi:hypothetical protein
MNEKQLQLCSFEQAKALKELGFNWEVSNHWNIKLNKMFICTPDNSNDSEYFYSCPTVALALKYMRDVKGVVCDVCYGENENENIKYYARIYHPDFLSKEYDTYPQGAFALLDEIIKHLKSEK